MRDLRVGDRLDQYLITDVLARTEMTMVYDGRDTEGGGRVCIKVPHLHYESDVVFHQRFEREERILRRLDHRGVVRALEPRCKSRMYTVTEYLEGKTLRTLIGEGALSAAGAVEIACQLCETLTHLHERRIVHRDVKPENVVVGPDGRITLLDFGIALDLGARRLTWGRLSHTAGTPDYVAPERIKGRRGDQRSDIYSAGLVLYEMLTGHLPQPGGDAQAIMRARTTEEPLPPTYFAPGLDQALSSVVCKAIARLPADRHQTATELLRALRDPGTASDAVALAGRPARRSLALPAVVIAAVLAALFSLTWVSRRASPSEIEHERAHANEHGGSAGSAAP